jgi:hypothetical protein
VQPDVKE